MESLHELIFTNGLSWGESLAFERCDTGGTVSYREFAEDVARTADFFRTSGFENRHIILAAENSYEWIVAAIGIMFSGCVLIPADAQLADSQLRKQAEFTEARLALCSSSFDGVYDGVCETISLKRLPQVCRKYSSAVPPFCKPDRNRPVMIIFTSGTMGSPKGVMLSESNIMASLSGGMARIDPSGKVFAMLPMNHAYAFLCGVFGALGKGQTVIINDRLQKFLPNMKQYCPGMMFTVPMVLEQIRKKILQESKRQGSLQKLERMRKLSRFLLRVGIDVRRKVFNDIHQQLGGQMRVFVCGGAPLKNDLLEFFTDIGFAVLNGYGITECAPLVAVVSNKEVRGRRGGRHLGVGHPIPTCHVRIRRPDQNGEGEVCVRGANTMLGYYHDQTATERVFEDSWLLTGDIGRLDEDGHLFILGRTKNMILLPNGKNVYPEELEAVLMQNPKITETVVYLGSNGRITAEVYCEEDSADRNMIRAWIAGTANDELPLYARIQDIRFRDREFEKTSTKKIKRTMIHKEIS